MEINKSLLNKRIPTILALVLLLGGLVGGIILVSKPQSLLTKAGPTATPQNVRITNKTDHSLTVSWISDTPVVGAVEYSNNPTKLEMTARDKRDVTGSAGSYTTHLVEINNLGPNTIYYLRIVSGSDTYLDGETPYQVKTWAKTTQVAGEDLIRGKVTTTSGTGLGGAIVYIDVEGGETMAVLTDSNGSWLMDLVKSRSNQGEVVGYNPESTRLSIFVQGGIAGTAMALTNTGNDNPVPDITIGGKHNFIETELETLSTTQTTTNTDREGFGNLSSTLQETATAELLNPEKDGEHIATSSPEFKGKLPAGTEITITVNSETEQTATVIVGDDGEWSWTPPEDLETGDHTITLEYEDELGVLQKIIRSFVVLAAGDDGVPAFTATPSATPTTTPSPSPTVNPATTMSSMPSTEGGVPAAGVLTQTVWLLTLGVGLFIFGFVLKRRVI